MERAAEAIGVHIAGLEADGEAVPEEREPPRLVTVTVARPSAADGGAAICPDR